jgi:transposase-like protein
VDVLRIPAKVHSEKGHAMALDDPALLELLEALKAADVDDRVRSAGTPRKVDDLVRALGADTGISMSEVSRICADLDAEVSAFRDRSPAGQAFP